MPNIARAIYRLFLHQTLVYWPKTGSDEFGKPAYGTAQELPTRWELKAVEMVMPDGRKVITKNYVLTNIPLEAGSLVWLGTIAEWRRLPGYPNPPTVNQGAQEVTKPNSSPVYDNSGVVYESFTL